jgi:hypothetical protein
MVQAESGGIVLAFLISKAYRRYNIMGLPSFFIGVVVGVYLDQSHSMPNVEKWVKVGVRKIKEWEENSRK